MVFYNVFSTTVKSIIVFVWAAIIISILFISGNQTSSSSKKTLNLLVWAQVLDSDFFEDFERDTGVKVNVGYFEHNEEVFLKLKSTSSHGYDLIMPSDFMLEQMIAHDMVKKIDTSRLTFWDNIYPQLKNNFADPHSQYSIPYYWGLFGLAIDRSIMGHDIEPSWGLLFDERQVKESVCVVDEPRVLIQMAAFYLFGRMSDLSQEEIEKIKQLLITQKRWVSLYTNLRPDYAIATRVSPVGLVIANDILKMLKEFKDIDFVIPKEGTFAVIDAFSIPKQSDKDEIIYQFLNYLYSPVVLKKYVERYQFLPAVNTVQLSNERSKDFIPNDDLFKKVHFFKNILPEKQFHDIWLAVKAE